MCVQTSHRSRSSCAYTTPARSNRACAAAACCFPPDQARPRNATADQPSVVFDRPSTVHSTRTQNSSAAVRRERQHTPRHNTKKMEGPLACPTCRKRRNEEGACNKVWPRRTAPAASRRASPSWPCPAATPSARTALEDSARGWSTRPRTRRRRCRRSVGSGVLVMRAVRARSWPGSAPSATM